MDFIRNIRWTQGIFAILALLALLVIGMVTNSYIKEKLTDVNPDVLIPVVAIGSAVGLLFSLAFLSIVFSALDLSDRSQALGLPEGSIRALIALLLITLYIVTAIFLYNQLRFPAMAERTTRYIGISEAELTQIPLEEVVAIRVTPVGVDGAEERTFDVDRELPRVEKSAVSQRFAEQILTFTSTLVATIAAFYFGARSVAVAHGVTVPLLPVIRSIKPGEGNQGEEIKDIEILGKDFESPKTVKLVLGSDEMAFAEVMSSSAMIRCKLTIPTSQQTGKYELIVINADGGEDRLTEAFEVKQKPQGGSTEERLQEPLESVTGKSMEGTPQALSVTESRENISVEIAESNPVTEEAKSRAP